MPHEPSLFLPSPPLIAVLPTTTYFTHQEQAVQRWRDVFFNVWDAKWNDPKNMYFPFHNYTYRQANRQIISKRFDRLEELAVYFSRDERGSVELKEFTSEEEIPFFSKTHSETGSGRAYPKDSFFLGRLIEWLTHSIVFVLSDENRKMAIGFFEIVDVWVAVDVMAILCDTYSESPSVTYQTVENWQRKMIDIWKTRLAEESLEWTEEDELYRNVIGSFDKLKTLAQKYPPLFA